MAELKIQAKNDYIITTALVEDNKQPFEVIDSNRKQNHFEVLSVGDDVKSCKVGDKVLPDGQEFRAFPFEGKQYVVMTDSQIIGVFK